MAPKWMCRAANIALNSAKDDPVIATVGISGLAVAAALAVAIAPAIGALNFIGVGARGVASASAAATTHSAIGNVAAGSIFAKATSAAAGGYGVTTLTTVA
ncbi:Interferon-induced 6-16 family [Microdochium nivale]|nr:Interferon-induced 6-16 family [Microdochium nivale]